MSAEGFVTTPEDRAVAGVDRAADPERRGPPFEGPSEQNSEQLGPSEPHENATKQLDGTRSHE
jgi:hypothetical protein